MKVLVVVEDDLAMQKLIGVMIAMDTRIDVCGSAATAAEAVELAREAQPDLVILDHFIDGDVMGLQAAPLIKDAAPDARILLFTSHDLKIEASREPAVDAYLSKNDIRLLLPTVLSLLDLDPPVAV
jgi:DNA-binding NarL/FixJ family response regulator